MSATSGPGSDDGVFETSETLGRDLHHVARFQYGVRPGQIEWWVGGQEQAGREPRTRLDPPDGIVIRTIPSNETLSSLLIQGQIEAIISARAPSCLASHPHIVARLFPDYRAAEELYFRSTRMFPLMHALGIRKELAARHPWLAVSLFKAFQASKDMCMRDLLQVNFLRSSLPWLGDDVRRVQALMGEDYWLRRRRGSISSFEFARGRIVLAEGRHRFNLLAHRRCGEDCWHRDRGLARRESHPKRGTNLFDPCDGAAIYGRPSIVAPDVESRNWECGPVARAFRLLFR